MMSAFDGETGMSSESLFVVWGRKVFNEPEAALEDILSGTGARGTQQRSEPEDFLADLLTHPAHREVRAQLAHLLDAALLKWIEARCEWPPGRVARFGTRAYAARMSDALAVAARLPLKATAREMMRNHVVWDDRFRWITLAREISTCCGNSTWCWYNIRPIADSLLVGSSPVMRPRGAVPIGRPG